MAAITGALIVGAAAVGAAAISAKGAKDAAKSQADALNNVKGVDIPAVQQQAQDADLTKYENQFNYLNQFDPQTGQLRDTTNTALNQYASNDTNSNSANQILGTLFNENAAPNAADTQFSNTAKTQAQGLLDQGGQLSPDQQAEFVRAGLEGASTTGLNSGSAATRDSVGKLLASEQLQQQQTREGMAQQLFGFATNLQDNRNSQLQGIANTDLAASQAQGNKLLQLSNLADSRVPNIGLSGGDIANLAVGNQNTSNNVAMQQGAVGAANAQAQAKITSGLVGGLSSAAGQYLNSYKTPPTTTYQPTAVAGSPYPV